ncbi:unnamed protein product, partial [Phaeothamnion confervicola]
AIVGAAGNEIAVTTFVERVDEKDAQPADPRLAAAFSATCRTGAVSISLGQTKRLLKKWAPGLLRRHAHDDLSAAMAAAGAGGADSLTLSILSAVVNDLRRARVARAAGGGGGGVRHRYGDMRRQKIRHEYNSLGERCAVVVPLGAIDGYARLSDRRAADIAAAAAAANAVTVSDATAAAAAAAVAANAAGAVDRDFVADMAAKAFDAGSVGEVSSVKCSNDIGSAQPLVSRNLDFPPTFILSAVPSRVDCRPSIVTAGLLRPPLLPRVPECFKPFWSAEGTAWIGRRWKAGAAAAIATGTQPMPMVDAVSTIREIMDEFAPRYERAVGQQSSGIGGGSSGESLAEFVYLRFALRYGLIRAAEERVVALLEAAAVHAAGWSILRLFLRCLGAVPAGGGAPHVKGEEGGCNIGYGCGTAEAEAAEACQARARADDAIALAMRSRAWMRTRGLLADIPAQVVDVPAQVVAAGRGGISSSSRTAVAAAAAAGGTTGCPLAVLRRAEATLGISAAMRGGWSPGHQAMTALRQAVATMPAVTVTAAAAAESLANSVAMPPDSQGDRSPTAWAEAFSSSLFTAAAHETSAIEAAEALEGEAVGKRAGGALLGASNDLFQ